jgi:hypothetical protein
VLGCEADDLVARPVPPKPSWTLRSEFFADDSGEAGAKRFTRRSGSREPRRRAPQTTGPESAESGRDLRVGKIELKRVTANLVRPLAFRARLTGEGISIEEEPVDRYSDLGRLRCSRWHGYAEGFVKLLAV